MNPSWLDIKNEINSTFGDATIFFIGRNVFEETIWPQHINTLETALFAINDAYNLNHRGNADIGSYETKKLGAEKFLITCDNPCPFYFNMGLVKGICNNFVKDGYQISIIDNDQSGASGKSSS